MTNSDSQPKFNQDAKVRGMSGHGRMHGDGNTKKPPLPPSTGLTASALLAPAKCRTVSSAFSDAAKKAREAGAPLPAKHRRACDIVLEEIEKASAMPQAAGENKDNGVMGPRVLTHANKGSRARAFTREAVKQAELKVVTIRSQSPARRSLSPAPRKEDASRPVEMVFSETSVEAQASRPFFSNVPQSSVGPPSKWSSNWGEGKSKRPGTSMTNESEMDAHLPPEHNPWAVLEKLRQHPERTEFRYMMAYQKNPFIPKNPYHLKVLPNEKCDKKDYYTLSLHGITHFLEGRPDFIELEEWKRERFLFDSVLQIPLFSRYLWWKMFKVWKMWVKYSKIDASRKFLEKNFFRANPTLNAMLIQLRMNCFGLFAVPLCSDAAEGMHTLQEFSRLQERQRAHVLRHMEVFWADTLQGVKNACTRVLTDVEADYLREQEEAKTGGQGKVQATVRRGYAALTRKKDEAPDFKYTMIAAKRAMHKLLYNFMRLCDYVVFATLHKLVLVSVEDMLLRFTSEDDRQVMFTCELHMCDETLELIPNDVEFTTEINGIVGSFITTASSGARLLKHPDIAKFTELYEGDALSELNVLYQIVTQDDRYQMLLSKLHSSSRAEFRKCSEALAVYDVFVKQSIENSSLDIKRIEEEAVKHRTDFSEYVMWIQAYRDQVGFVCVCMRVHVSVFVNARTRMSACVCARAYMRMCVRESLCLSVCVCVGLSVCRCVRACVSVCVQEISVHNRAPHRL